MASSASSTLAAMGSAFESIPGVSAPARRALTGAGYGDLAALNGVDYVELAGLHGVGRRGLERLQTALVERGMSFGGDVPEPAQRKDTFVFGNTGKNAKDIKTKPTEQTPAQYVEELNSPRRVEHGRLLLAIFNRVTGAEPVMWGPSMIGYGQMHYVYDSGREGDTFRVGFSPRKSKISLYGMPHDGVFLSRLGKYTTGASCLYVNKPADVDLEVMADMIRHAWSSAARACEG